MDNVQPTTYPPLSVNPSIADSQGDDVFRPQWEKGPDKNEEGYNGKGKHFGVYCNVIKIKKSDALDVNRPSGDHHVREGTFSEYELQDPMKSDTYQSWMRKIGPYLADWALHLPRHENPPWKLLRFPDNYTLWVHKSGVTSDRGNPRLDAYLYGAPHLGPRSTSPTSPTSFGRRFTAFRSPYEFAPHAIWLMRGGAAGPLPCECKYCMPGRSQKEITRELNRGLDVVGSDDDGGGDDDDGDDDRVMAAERRIRRGGAAARGLGRGAVARRDRAPPINIDIARDYRVGVGATNPSPGTSSSAT